MKPTVGVFRRFFPTVFDVFLGVQRVQRAQLYGHRTGSSGRQDVEISALGPGEGRGHRLGALGGSGACSGAAVHGTCGTSELTLRLTQIDYKYMTIRYYKYD